MSDEQTPVPVRPDDLLAKVDGLHAQGWRLVHVGGTDLGDAIEVNYGFDLDGRFLSLRVTLAAAGARLPSITPVYWCAFIYENELHDLFNVRVDGIAIDYKGRFYRTSVPFPFSSRTRTAGVTPSGAVTNPPPPSGS